MITVTGKEMVVTRRGTRWMRTVLQSRTTRFAAATPTCKLHGLLFSPRRPVCRHTSLFQVQQLGGRSGLCDGTNCSRHGRAALLMFILPWYQSQCEKWKVVLVDKIKLRLFCLSSNENRHFFTQPFSTSLKKGKQ